jgi:hypothetical protein
VVDRSAGQWLRCNVMGDGGSYNDAPTPEEFEGARQRELARLNIRVSSITGETHHTPEDLKVVEGDTSYQRSLDMDTVRRWTANSERYGGGDRKLA